MYVKLTGKIKKIQQSEIFGSFEKRVFWLGEQDVQYPNTWQLECHQNDCNLLDSVSVGQMVECSVNIRGREWKKEDKGGVINTLQCWKIIPLSRPQTNGDILKEAISSDDVPF